MAQSGACVSCDAASSASAATSIADLPDDALARCLGFLELKERLCSAALVSKRFAAAACSPEPLREVDVTMTAAGMPSFVLWLARHGRHMRRFNCAANPLASRAEHAAAAGALTACLSAVGAAGRLQDLELKYCVASTAWLAATRSLRRLEIFSNSHHAVLLSPTISRLTQLEVLSVSGLERFTPDVRLPESITWLQVSDGSETMPAQIALLPNLKRLELSFCHYSSDSMGALTTLVGSLTRLKLASGILACLPELTQLQNLEWSAYGAGALEAASQALQRLTKLTCLDLAGIGSIPAALGSLPRLQRLALQDVGNAALPSGRMLRSLRWLGAPIDVLLDSTQLLREAGALEYVAVLDCSGNGIDWDSPAMAAFWDWLASHPPLRRLSIDAAWGEDSECDWYEILMRVLQLWRCRPSLAQRLAERNVQTARDLFQRTLLELVELLDLPYDTVRHILAEVAAKVSPQPRTVADLLRAAAAKPLLLRTSLGPLDAALLGGLPAGSVTELVGAAGLGKTQMCLQMCVLGCLERQAEGASVVYLDTEKKFSGRRMTQIARERFPEAFPGEEALAALASRVLVYSPPNSQALLSVLGQSLEQTVIDHKVRLIILDSAACLARADFAPGSLPDRQRMLGQQASRLKYLAEAFQIPVLVTNQVTTRIGGEGDGAQQGQLQAALGTMWAHAVNTRLVLMQTQGHRFLHVAKSPAAPSTIFAYRVTAAGLEDDPSVAPPRLAEGSVAHQAIANDQLFEQAAAFQA